MQKEKTIIIDTNGWMAVAEFKIDLFSELEKTCDFNYKIKLLSGTIEELKKITVEQRGKFRQAALLALKLIEVKKNSRKVQVVEELPEENESVDDLLAEHSEQGDLILTQDMGLKKRLKKPYLTIRQKKKIMIVK